MIKRRQGLTKRERIVQQPKLEIIYRDHEMATYYSKLILKGLGEREAVQKTLEHFRNLRRGKLDA
ncbi:MAG: hypothetical protein QT03_C0001G1025 [archaeon GW2011_AR10]|uniref:Uncharacterized protein n=1 Tax=Candidatus Iainarchaeum sp. TaxID=3101447 RepID=A0A7J4IW29_9ARCH|nr:MAG: hypothetical protein QT03_C0001G1025 [archaeon GW2011_AR10]HIH07927.1 hypothetical protein [Candidatus Diapherotrites archaeon]